MCQGSVSVWSYKDEWDVVFTAEEFIVQHEKTACESADPVRDKC